MSVPNSPPGAGPEPRTEGGLRPLLTRELLRQGPSFVVLLLLLVGGGRLAHDLMHHGLPAALDQIQTGYLGIQNAHDRNLTRLVDAFERETQRTAQLVTVLERLVESDRQTRRDSDELRAAQHRLANQFDRLERQAGDDPDLPSFPRKETTR